jgi:hypothetical protein
MTPEQQRIKIAEVCGKDADYLNDLNAMHDALSYVSNHKPEWCWSMFSYRLNELLDRYHYDCDGPVFLATAAQIAEASLKTLDLWEDKP